jgi:hypothetical protein
MQLIGLLILFFVLGIFSNNGGKGVHSRRGFYRSLRRK